MPKPAQHAILLILCGIAGLLIYSGPMQADNRPTTKPKEPVGPTAAQITQARSTLARAIARPEKLTDATAKQIKGLIEKLSDPVWKVRENASSELVKYGPEILPMLNAAANHKDLEVSDRVGVAIKKIQSKVEDVGTDLNSSIEVLAAVGDKKLIDMLLELLNHAGLSGRYTAEYALRRLTGENFGFNTRDEPSSRAAAVGKWRKWWKDKRASFSFDQAQIKARSVALLISNNGTRNVTAVSIRGKTIWTKKMRATLYCAAGTGNGNIIVGYSSSPKNIEEYDAKGKSVWAPTSVPNGTGGVFDIERLANGNTLIAYTHRGHVTEINAKGKVVWQMTGLKSPISAQRLKNGNTLIAEHSGARVIEVDRKNKVVWQKTGLKSPGDAVMLPNGNVLIGEYSGKKVLEVDRKGKVLWQRNCPAAVSGVCRLPDGSIAITNSNEGAILLSRDGKKVIRKLLAHNGSWGKIRLAPAAILTHK
ncbi:MAG: PQQ-binding-like beta-propeller repeat protein [Phycisphaerae bacterium]|nr:PQQ-binding-like beta-propeller repeat protein [Phycisphaerae bacterium]